MRRLAILALLAACGTDSATAPDASETATRTFSFGPFELQPGEELNGKCVQITLANTDYIYVNQVELTTGTLIRSRFTRSVRGGEPFRTIVRFT